MKKGFLASIVLCMVLCLSACCSGNDKGAGVSPDQESREITVADEADNNTSETEVLQDTSEQETDMAIETISDEVIENQTETEEEQMLKIEVGDQVLYAEFEANSSAEALREKLAEEPLALDMHDYGNFEKVSDLPWSLPRNDTQITTEPGDVILYLGNELTIYYDTNSWNFTRVAKIKDVDGKTLKSILGDGNVTVAFSIE